MSETIDHPVFEFYAAPGGYEDMGEREEDGKRLFLYIGDRALVDVVELIGEGDNAVLGELLLRAEAPKEKGTDLLHHPTLFISETDALRVFGRVRMSAEDLYGEDIAA